MVKALIKALLPAKGLSLYRACASWYKRRTVWLTAFLVSPRAGFHEFVCNICGEKTSFPRKKMMRETQSCLHCGSSVRYRSIIHTLSMELFGESLSIDSFPERHDLTGAGMSDWDGYATRLKQKLSYTNTYYHKEPFLDIASPEPPPPNLYDFMISTDVFEHVSQPISRAFENVHRMLKPGGVFIFSVPCVEGETREHFPELCRFTIRKEKQNWVLLNETVEGRHQRFDHLVFHEGPGSIVEMRLFGRESLVKHFSDAGFTRIRNHSEAVDECGILWNTYVPEDAPYRPLIYGLDAPPWSARKD